MLRLGMWSKYGPWFTHNPVEPGRGCNKYIGKCKMPWNECRLPLNSKYEFKLVTWSKAWNTLALVTGKKSILQLSILTGHHRSHGLPGLTVRAPTFGSLSPQKPGLSHGFQAEPSPHITTSTITAIPFAPRSAWMRLDFKRSRILGVTTEDLLIY